MPAYSWRVLHFEKDERAYIASERFLSPETDSLLKGYGGADGRTSFAFIH